MKLFQHSSTRTEREGDRKIFFHDFHFRKKKLKFFGFRERRRVKKKKSLIVFRKFIKNHIKFTALQLNLMPIRLINWLRLIYHFLIHKIPPEIPSEKILFHNFHFKDFPYNIWMLMSLWDFFIHYNSRSVCRKKKAFPSFQRHKTLPQHPLLRIKCYVLISL